MTVLVPFLVVTLWVFFLPLVILVPLQEWKHWNQLDSIVRICAVGSCICGGCVIILFGMSIIYTLLSYAF